MTSRVSKVLMLMDEETDPTKGQVTVEGDTLADIAFRNWWMANWEDYSYQREAWYEFSQLTPFDWLMWITKEDLCTCTQKQSSSS